MAKAIDTHTAKVHNVLKKTGDTMISGFLTLFQDPVLDFHAVTKRYVDRLVSATPGLQIGGLQQQGVGTNIDNFGLASPGTQGTATSFQDSTGSYVNYASASSGGAQAGWLTSASATQRQMEPDVLVTLKSSSSLTNMRHWVALANITIITSDMEAAGFTTANIMGFRWDSALDTNWQCCCRGNSASLTKVDSGVPIVANTRYIMRIDASDTSKVEFYINDVLVGTINTNLPDLTTTLNLTVGATTSVASSVNIRVRRAQITSR